MKTWFVAHVVRSAFILVLLSLLAVFPSATNAQILPSANGDPRRETGIQQKIDPPSLFPLRPEPLDPDYIPAGPGLYENDDEKIRYTGTWMLQTNQNAHGGSFHRSDIENDTVSIYVKGATSVTIGIIRKNSYGKAKVWIDGFNQGNFDSYNATFEAATIGPYTMPDLDQHEIKVQVLRKKQDASSGYYIGLDYFEVDGPPPTPTPTNTATASSTHTPTNMPTHTATWTPTNTETYTPTSTITPTFAPTETETPTATLTPTHTPSPTLPPQLDSFALINRDFENGTLDLNRATEYKIYALFSSQLLPPTYQSAVPIPEEGSVALLETVEQWDQLDEATRQTLSDFLTAKDASTGAPLQDGPSTFEGTEAGVIIAGCTLPGVQFTAHFHIFYDWSPAGLCGGVSQTYIETLATGLEAAFTQYANMGYLMPPTVTEVFVVPLQLAHGNTPAISLPGFIFVANNVNLNANIGGDTGPLYLQTLVAHEFFHSVQWGYFNPNPPCQWSGMITDPYPFPYLIPSRAWWDFEDVRWWMEASAQWAQHEVYQNDVSYFHDVLNLYLSASWRHMDTRPISGENFTYGTVLYPIYLAEHLPVGGNLIRITWMEYSQLNNACGAMMPAMEEALQTQNTSMAQAFEDFAEANYWLDYDHQADFRNRFGNAYRPASDQPPELNEDVAIVNGPTASYGGESVEHLGTAYIEFANGFAGSLGRALTIDMTMTLTNPSADPVVKVWAITQYAPPNIIYQTIPVNIQSEPYGSQRRYTVSAGVPNFDSYQWVAMGISNPQTNGDALSYGYTARVIPPAVVYAGGHQGNVSVDGGATWNRYSFPNQATVQAVAAVSNAEGQIGYMATSDLKLWKTMDRGLTYSPLYDFAPRVAEANIVNTVTALVTLDPTDADTIYVGIRGEDPPGGWGTAAKGMLYKSDDGGSTFGEDLLPHNTDNDWKKSAIYSLAIDPRNRLLLYIGQDAYNNQPQQVMKSLNGGETWMPVCTTGCAGGGPARVKLSPIDSSIIWVFMGVNQGHAICYSTNGAGAWNCKSQPLEQFMWSGFFGIAPSLVDPLKATASGSEAWFRRVGQTTDGNVSWTTLNTTYGPNDLARDPAWEDRLFAANNNGDTNHGGVIVSYDGGTTWTEYTLGWTNSISVVSK